MLDAKKQLEMALIAVTQTRDEANMAKNKASKFEANHVAELRRRRDDTRELMKQLRQPTASAAARTKASSAVHDGLELQRAKAESLEKE